MKTISGKEFASILEKHGWILKRIQGSHHIYSKEGKVERISIPIHGSSNLKIGLLKHLLKISGLDEKDLN
ncbi:MAG: type II toxin-antitoxin system HicA family toxin [Ignavibacteria bacterium]|nr:type II toxin-antitoxin system HicA family toxin [Ignavibacteria bacterium]